MARCDDIIGAGCAQPVLGFDLRDLKALVYSHNSRERIRWFRAYINPNWDSKKGTPHSADKWIYREMDTAGKLAIIRSGQAIRRYTSLGDLWDSDISITTYYNDLPLGDHDIVIPIGLYDITPNQQPDYRTTERKEQVVRGGDLIDGVGRISSQEDKKSSNATSNVIGVGTAFLSFFRPGDVIKVGIQKFVVTAVINNALLTIDGIPSPSWNRATYQRGRETLSITPAVALVDARTATREYTFNQVSIAEEASLRWLDVATSPAPDSRISVIYRFQNRYIVQYDLGIQRHVVNGESGLSSFIARLYSYQDRQE